MHDCLERGEAPLASHLLYTQSSILDDDVAEERTLGINAGFAWAKHAELSAVYTDFGISDGMKLGIEDAEKNNRPVEYRKLFDFSDMKQSKQIDELSKYTYKNADIIEESNVCACYFCLKTFPSHLVIDFVDKGKTALCPVCKTESVYGDASGFSMHPKFVALAGKWYFDGSSETF